MKNTVPVVSLNVDPDEIICKNGLGFHSGTFEQMIKDVRSLLDNETLRREIGNKATKHEQKNIYILTIFSRIETCLCRHISSF